MGEHIFHHEDTWPRMDEVEYHMEALWAVEKSRHNMRVSTIVPLRREI